MRRVRIKERSAIARLAAGKLKYGRVAMVIGNTIFLHNVTTKEFLRSKRWVMHELKHVEQYQTFGVIKFLWLYLREYLRNGYRNNKYEIEARNAERDESLLLKYDMSPYIIK